MPQEEYAREGIDWSYVEFIDNQDCLDVLEGSQDAPSLAVFPLIDEACRLPRATYQVCCVHIAHLAAIPRITINSSMHGYPITLVPCAPL